MPRVTYVEAGGVRHDIDVDTGDNVMRGAQMHDLPGIVGECGGGLACATCHCYIDDAWTEKVGGPASQAERDMLESTAAEVKPTSRLSCQIELSDELNGLIVHMPDRQY